MANNTDDPRIGIYGSKFPTLTVCGNPLAGQYRQMADIGNGRYVVVGHDDIGYDDEIKKLITADEKKPKRKDTKGSDDSDTQDS